MWKSPNRSTCDSKKVVYSYGERRGDELEIIQIQSESPLIFQIREGHTFYEVKMPLHVFIMLGILPLHGLTAHRMGIDSRRRIRIPYDTYVIELSKYHYSLYYTTLSSV